MNDMTREQVLRLITGELEKLGLTRLARMFAIEHNVPRGTHKAEAGAKVGDAETLAGHHATDFSLVGHTHPGMIAGDYDSELKALYVSSE